MLATYKATLKGDRLEWKGEVPPRLSEKQALTVHVTILDDTAVSEHKNIRGKQMAEILGQLAAADSLPEIKDPAVWERKVRQDRPLPERDE